MSEDNNNDFEIGDVENFVSNKDQSFNHGILVMTAMKNVIEAGKKEMRSGWTDNKQDRQGNKFEIYHEDTRRVFISCVKTLKLVMTCDLDTEAEKVVKDLLKELDDKKKEYLETQEKMWKKLLYKEREEKRNKGEPHIEGILTNSFLKDDLTEFQLNIYERMFGELSNLTKRLDFFKADSLEN